MLKRIKTIFRKKAPTHGGPHIIPAGDHPLKPNQVSQGARKVVEVLGNEGFEAYLVGGCVRDLMLDLHPKDFDVATNATPEQVKSIFRRSRIVGRRFQIVHVRMRSEVIEVTTFRGSHQQPGKHSRQESQRSSQGMLLRDNIFGTIDDDAARRDFTVNAFYYHPQDNTVYDYADGQRDIEQRLIRIIGDPETRYREDPVRMLRAIRFSAKLGFTIEPTTAKPIQKLSPLLGEISSARLFDESLKLLMSGYSLATSQLLRDHGLFDILFPGTASALQENPEALALIEQALTNTDLRIRNDQRVTPAFIYAALLWPQVNLMRAEMERNGDSPQYALQRAASKVTSQQCQVIAIPKRFTYAMREIWELQLRLPKRNGNRALRLMETQRFRAGYDFLLLREQAGEIEPGLGHWWTDFQAADDDKRQKMVSELDSPSGKRKRRRRPRRRTNKSAPSSPTPEQ